LGVKESAVCVVQQAARVAIGGASNPQLKKGAGWRSFSPRCPVFGCQSHLSRQAVSFRCGELLGVKESAVCVVQQAARVAIGGAFDFQLKKGAGSRAAVFAALRFAVLPRPAVLGTPLSAGILYFSRRLTAQVNREHLGYSDSTLLK